MEKTEVGFEDKITRFEAACGPLTDSYPWDFDSYYAIGESFHSLKIRL